MMNYRHRLLPSKSTDTPTTSDKGKREKRLQKNVVGKTPRVNMKTASPLEMAHEIFSFGFMNHV
jgi:hypothetical protein